VVPQQSDGGHSVLPGTIKNHHLNLPQERSGLRLVLRPSLKNKAQHRDSRQRLQKEETERFERVFRDALQRSSRATV